MLDDSDRLSTLIAKERGRLVAAAQRVLRDAHEAEDTVQDTLAAVWRIERVVPPKRLRPYVYRAVRLNALKRRARRREHRSLTEDYEAAAEEQASWDIDPITLEQALAGLPTTQQAVLRLRYYSGLTFREIGAALSISMNTAASRCRYALDQLRRTLETQNNLRKEQGDE